MAECKYVRSGDVVIRCATGDGPCATVVVTEDAVLPDERWTLYTFREALLLARQMTEKTGGAIWQLGPERGQWNRID